MRLTSFAAAAALVLAGPVQAASLTNTYSSFFAFGDSLSDTGNLFASTGGSFPPTPPYFDGRFSNGLIWADSLIGEFTAASRAAAGFAFGFATASFDGPVPDFAEQRLLFSANVPAAALGARPLASVWFGANDLFGAVDGGADVATAGLVGAGAALATAQGVTALAAAGIDDFLLFNLPDLGATPAYALPEPGATLDDILKRMAMAAAASAGSAAFNTVLDAQIVGLRAQGLNVALVDIAELFEQLIDDPSLFGLTDAVNPCLLGGVLDVAQGTVTPCLSAEGRAFWDSVHPTAPVHAIIAAEAREALTPVPLPAGLPMLVLALAGLAAVRGVRRA